MLNLTFKGGSGTLFGDHFIVPRQSGSNGKMLDNRRLSVINAGSSSILYKSLVNGTSASNLRLANVSLTIATGLTNVEFQTSTQSLPTGFSSTMSFSSTSSPVLLRNTFCINKKNYCILRRSSDGAGVLFELSQSTSNASTFNFVNTNVTVTSSLNGVASASSIQFVHFDQSSSALYVISERAGGSGLNPRTLVIARCAITATAQSTTVGAAQFAEAVATRQADTDAVKGWWICVESDAFGNNILYFARTMSRVARVSVNTPLSSYWLRTLIKVNVTQFNPNTITSVTFQSPIVQNFSSASAPWPGEILGYCIDYGNVVIQQDGSINALDLATAQNNGPIVDFMGQTALLSNFALIRDLRDFV